MQHFWKKAALTIFRNKLQFKDEPLQRNFFLPVYKIQQKTYCYPKP